MAVGQKQRDERIERMERIDILLEELRLNTEDLRELAKQAIERSQAVREQTRTQLNHVREMRRKRQGR